MSSKLDYLSKYGGGAPTASDGGEGSHKKKKKKKEKKHKKSRRDNEEGGAAIRDMDDINAFVPGSGDNGYLDEEDRPTVVDGVAVAAAIDVPSSGPGRGFRTVPADGAGAADNVSRAGRRPRHDSESEDDAREKNPPRSRRRHDSDSSDDDKQHRCQARRQRHDSESDDGSDRHRNKARRRHDSDSEEGSAGAHRRRRHDSLSDDSHAKRRHRSAKGRRRHDSDSEAGSAHGAGKAGRYRRHDSDSDDGHARKKHRKRDRKRRHDSASDDGSHGSHKHRKRDRKRRHDSDSGDGSEGSHQRRGSRRRRHDSSGSDSEGDGPDSKGRAKKMASGHKSGLQDASDFAHAEKKFRKRQREELAQHNAENGDTGETIYRDARGKKRVVSAAHDEERLRREEEEKQEKQRQLNKGAYQKRLEEARLRELAEASTMTLARGVEDAQLEERKKAIIREGDPMAMHEWKKQQEAKAKQSSRGSGVGAAVPTKPVYKGPQPKPNRYGIRPGYRWDGIDRGNGFEDRVLEALHSKGRKKEEAYKWSAADM